MTQEQSLYPGFNIILEGPTGTGKTYSIGTLCEAGLEVFYYALEPGLESVIGYFTDPPPHGKGMKTPPENFHWNYLSPKTQSFDQMRSNADNIGKFDLSGLAKMRDINRAKNNPMIDVYTNLNNFVDQRDGKSYGPIDSWLTNRVLVIDGLSALSRIAMEMVTGNKPMRDKPDYGLAQGNLMSLIHKLTSGCACHLVLLAHVNREVDEVLGGVKLFPNTIGKAILSDIQQPFSDVILSVREGDKFYWDTANSQADLKARNLPIAQKLPPDFRQIVEKWKARRNSAIGA